MTLSCYHCEIHLSDGSFLVRVDGGGACVYCMPNINRQAVGGRGAEAWGWTAEGDYREIKKGMWGLIHCYTAVLWVSTHRERAKKRQTFLQAFATQHTNQGLQTPFSCHLVLTKHWTALRPWAVPGPLPPSTSTTSRHLPSPLGARLLLPSPPQLLPHGIAYL